MVEDQKTMPKKCKLLEASFVVEKEEDQTHSQVSKSNPMPQPPVLLNVLRSHVVEAAVLLVTYPL